MGPEILVFLSIPTLHLSDPTLKSKALVSIALSPHWLCSQTIKDEKWGLLARFTPHPHPRTGSGHLELEYRVRPEALGSQAEIRPGVLLHSGCALGAGGESNER